MRGRVYGSPNWIDDALRLTGEVDMLQFLHYVQTSMSANRRANPTAQDFASALALMPNASSASLLKAQVKMRLPHGVSNPSIGEPDPPPAPAADFSNLLQPLMTTGVPAYIPKHFPQLPPQHAWKQTPVFPQRENDAHKMRERATEEGIQAELALRKLAAAAKSGVVKAGKSDVLGEAIFKDMLAEV